MVLKRNLGFIGIVFALCIAPAGFGAQQEASKTAALAPGEGIANLDTLKSEVRQYHDCTGRHGCYTKDLDLQADRAIAFLRQRTAHRKPDEKLALVLDIDETTLSNYAEMVKADFAYDSTAFNAWVETAKAPVIPGTLRLYKEAQNLGVTVIFLTGRSETQRAVTEQNLRDQGFSGWQQLIMRHAADADETALKYKSAERGTLVKQGFTLVLNVGDQWSDLKGVPEAEFSVKYPDPFYYIP